MANSAQARKRARQSDKQREHNTSQRSEFRTAVKKLKVGGIFTYYSDEIDSFSPTHLQKLTEAGFKRENIKGEIIFVEPPKNCQYWKSNTMLAPVVIK